jgi:Kef-type K+ transport system membrane component KefB
MSADALAAVVTLVAPMLGGVALARWFHAEHAPAGVRVESFALFMAAGRDLLRTRVGALAIVRAAFDDVAA